MTDRELFEKALDALKEINKLSIGENAICLPAEIDGAMDALRERLAQPVHPECKTRRTTREEKIVRPSVYEVPVEQETVMAEYKFQTYAAYKTPDGEMKIGVVPDDAPLTLNGVPLYPRREWVGLTADEIWKCNAAPKGSAVEYHICMAHQNVLDFAEAIEAKLKEKNA